MKAKLKNRDTDGLGLTPEKWYDVLDVECHGEKGRFGEVKKVLIDGKEFFSDDPKVASKNLPSKMVEKVQVLDRLSDMARMTGFDDGDEETVINLTVKPGMKQGWFGNAFAGYGSEDRYEGNFMVNRFINNDQFTLMGGINNTNNMGFSELLTGIDCSMRG